MTELLGESTHRAARDSAAEVVQWSTTTMMEISLSAMTVANPEAESEHLSSSQLLCPVNSLTFKDKLHLWEMKCPRRHCLGHSGTYLIFFLFFHIQRRWAQSLPFLVRLNMQVIVGYPHRFY